MGSIPARHLVLALVLVLSALIWPATNRVFACGAGASCSASNVTAAGPALDGTTPATGPSDCDSAHHFVDNPSGPGGFCVPNTSATSSAPSGGSGTTSGSGSTVTGTTSGSGSTLIPNSFPLSPLCPFFLCFGGPSLASLTAPDVIPGIPTSIIGQTWPLAPLPPGRLIGSPIGSPIVVLPSQPAQNTSGPPLTVTISKSNPVKITIHANEYLDLTHSVVIRLAPGVTPTGVQASTGTLTVVGGAVIWNGFVLQSGDDATATLNLSQTNGTVVGVGAPAIQGIAITALDQSGMTVTFQAPGGGPTTDTLPASCPAAAQAGSCPGSEAPSATITLAPSALRRPS